MSFYKALDANLQDLQGRQFSVGETITDVLLDNPNRISFYETALDCMVENASVGGEVATTYRFVEVRPVGDDIGVALFSRTTRTATALQVICELTRDEFLSRCTGRIGRESSEVHYHEGRRHGFWRFWSQNKVLTSEAEYQMGILLHSTSWFETGQMRSRQSYRQGKLHGTSQSWRKNGKLETEAHYIDGKLEGVWRQWCTTGQLQIEAHYTLGQLNGPWQRWYNSGQLELFMTYRDGKLDGPWHRRSPSGQIELELVYGDGKVTVRGPRHDNK